jgi:hypothetical protein
MGSAPSASRMRPGCATLAAPRAFLGKVASGFPSKNATNAKMLERFLFPVYVKPL